MTADRDLAPDTSHVAAERLTFFTDAVVAIAITLLAIELPVPTGETADELLASLQAGSFEYLAFLVSFAVIGRHWTLHHQVFRYVRRADGLVTALNLGWLLLIVLTPFFTKVLSEGELIFPRFAIYAGAQALQMGVFAAMVALIARRGWFAAGAPRSRLTRGYVPSLIVAIGMLGSIPLFPLLGAWAFALWVLVPVVLDRIALRTGLVRQS